MKTPDVSSKRLLIEDALRLHRRLWARGHPEFKSLNCDSFVEEELTRGHIRAFSRLLGKQDATTWGNLSETELRLYIFALRIECAHWELDLLDRVDQLIILPEES